MSSASLNDPSTGDFNLELPSGAVESVEVLSNPFAAEYGRFSTSVTQVRSRARHQQLGRGSPTISSRDSGKASPSSTSSNPGSRSPARSSAIACCSASICSTTSFGSRSRPSPGNPAIRSGQLRLVHPARRQSIGASCPDRRPDLLSPQDHQRHALDVPSSGDDAKVHAGRITRRGSSIG